MNNICDKLYHLQNPILPIGEPKQFKIKIKHDVENTLYNESCKLLSNQPIDTIKYVKFPTIYEYTVKWSFGKQIYESFVCPKFLLYNFTTGMWEDQSISNNVENSYHYDGYFIVFKPVKDKSLVTMQDAKLCCETLE